MTKSALYVEDDSNSREQGLREILRNDIENVVAPETRREIEQVLRNDSFERAVIDFNLSKWVGVNPNKPINAMGTECHNGLELAEWLLERDPEMTIGLYSSNVNKLQESINQSRYRNRLFILQRPQKKSGSLYKIIPDFIKNYHLLNIQIDGHALSEELLPVEITRYKAQKVLALRNRCKDVWRVGDFIWKVAVNQESHETYAETDQQIGKSDFRNTRCSFQIVLDKDTFELVEMVDKESGERFNKNDFEDRILSGKRTHFQFQGTVFKLISCHQLTYMLLGGKLAVEAFFHALTGFESYFQLCAQKILFKNIAKLEGRELRSIEEMQVAMKKYAGNNFPSILDIYECNVASMKDKYGIIRMKSHGPERQVRKEHFKKELLQQYFLEEKSLFEYTIYRPPREWRCLSH